MCLQKIAKDVRNILLYLIQDCLNLKIDFVLCALLGLRLINLYNDMTSNYTEKQLRTSILNQKQDSNTFYYSIAKKQQKNFSFLTNDRLLILDFEQGKIFYSNEIKNLPFRSSMPSPKNEFAQTDSTLIRHLPNSPQIQFTFQYKKENWVWKFTFQNNELAEEWIKMIDFQKQSQLIKQKDMKSLNKAIFEMPKLEHQNADDIVKQPQRDIANDESRLINQMMKMSRNRSNTVNNNSRMRVDKSAINSSDWNYRFYRERHLLTLYQFQRAATETFYSSYAKDQLRKEPLRLYQNQAFIVKIASRYTNQAKTLKHQYRNYHFILEATSTKMTVGVPLCCLIEFQGVVALVKARFLEKGEVIAFDDVARNEIHELERYTRIKNKVIENCDMINMADVYDGKGGRKILIYLDNLQEYLPLNTELPNQQTLIRPEYMLDSVDYFVFSGNPEKITKSELRQLRELSLRTVDKAKQFSDSFYKQSFPVCRITELKNLIHEAGLNLKTLPYLYSCCSNVYVKRYIYSAMTAKIVKDHIFQNLMNIRLNDKNYSFRKLLEQTLAILLEGNNNRSHELWKELSLIFKKKYSISLNNKELLPGFFFNSLMQLLPGIYDISKINKKKKIFQETKVIDNGFVKEILPKVKSYQRFLPENISSLKIQAKQNIKSGEVCKKILNELFNPKDHRYEVYYSFGSNDEWMTDYLSLYYPPDKLADDNRDKIKLLYDQVNEEPPCFFSLTLTKNYLEWCNKKQNTDQFKTVFQKAMSIADYWLDEIHPVRSDLFQSLSDYYSILGVHEDMIRYMRDSLNICTKFWGAKSSQVGLKQYELADRFLRAGKKKQALEYFFKAKENMEENKTKTNKLGLALMKAASIYLSDLEYDKAVDYAQMSIKRFEEYEKRVNSYGIYNEPYKIKSYQILARIYEICDRRSDYKDLALGCARKFNNTKNEEVFQQMIRICLASAIFKSNTERCQSFLKLLQTIQQGRQSGLTPIQQLMKMSEDSIVMDRFIFRFEHFERSLFELNLKKRQLGEEGKEFMQILRNVVGVVGYDYIKGLIDERVSYSI